MGCICSCHDRMSAFALRGCCWECEKDHDPLRNALLQVSELQKELTFSKEVEIKADELIHAAQLQIDSWKRYHALLSEELESAVSVAYIHGWRSTPEKIEAGKKLRAVLGLYDNPLDEIIKKQKDEKQPEHDYTKFPNPKTCELCRLRIVGHTHFTEKPKCLRCGTEIPAGGHACGPVNQS